MAEMELPEIWQDALDFMHRETCDGRHVPWTVRETLGGHTVDLGCVEMHCPLGLGPEELDLLAKAPVLAGLIDEVAWRIHTEDDEELLHWQGMCRNMVGSAPATPVGGWKLGAARHCGVKSILLGSSSSEIGFVPVERKYVGDALEENIANLAVAASAPELMAVCICLADDVRDLGPYRFAIDTVVANWRLAALLTSSRRRLRTFDEAMVREAFHEGAARPRRGV